jgi:UDP-N-acetylmuramoyl-L-alanyl-D-glutamate--2,6-diaminopimelate ligase
VSGLVRPSALPPYPLAAVAGLVGARSEASLPGLTVTGITHASLQVCPGDLFVALPGAHAHGARYAAAAARAGAVAVLTDPAGAAQAASAGLPVLTVPDARQVLGPAAAAIYGDPTSRLAVIGLTGTAGKTTTAYLVESGLRQAGYRTGLIGTVETRLGDLVVDSARTTPEASDLQALFAVAEQRRVTAVVMEVSSHALALWRVGGTRFEVGGYTNFGTDHLDFHTSPADYFAAKARLFDGRCRYEVLNADDAALRPLHKPTTITYSAAGDPNATWSATAAHATGYAQHFTAIGPRGIEVPAAVALPGRHNVANALLALASLAALGIDPAVAAAGIAACPGVPGRLERVGVAGPVLGVVDYAHKPDAIVAALAALREAAGPAGRLICVIGAGGDRDRAKRPVMGAAAACGSDVVVVTDDNPRSEEPAAIRAAVLAGAAGAGCAARVFEVAGRRDAILQAVAAARPGDVVALLGKGHERGQEVAGEVHPFDDRVELAAALAHRFAGEPSSTGSQA